MRHLLTLFALIWAGIMQAQVATVPTVGEVNKKLDSLARVLRTEIASTEPGKPVEPGQKDCEYPIEIREIKDVSASGLTYQFHSVGVTEMRETIRNAAGTVVFTHITRPTWNTITLSFSLPAGDYSLQIENANCRASDKKGFTIHNSGDREEPTVPTVPTTPGAGFENKGVRSQQVGNLLYEWIPSQNVTVSVENNLVCIRAPETKHSFDGRNTCRRFVLGDLYDNELPEEEVQALFGDGLKLPPGNYAFRIIYVNTSSLAEVRENLWEKLGMGSGSSLSNSAEMELLYLSITDGNPVNGVPSDLLRTSWLPHYQLLHHDLKLPADKGFGTTRIIPAVGWEKLFRKFTHLQARYVGIPYGAGRLWNNVQAYDHSGQLAQPDWVIRNATVNKDFITLAELAENYGNIEKDCPRCYQKAEEVFKGLYGRYQNELGVKSPAETRLYDDYFGAMYGSGLEVPGTAPVSDLRQGLKSVKNAQDRYDEGRWLRSGYFANGAYEYRNFRLPGYIGNLFNTLPGNSFYSRIYNLEKVNLALPDRKILKNGWQNGEAVGLDQVTQSGAWLRLKLDGGDILRVEPNTWPMQTMMAESFYHLLLSNDYILWHSSVMMNTDPETFDQSWYGGFEKWKTKWNPAGSDVIVEYNPETPGHPKMKKSGDGSIFPENTLTGETGAFVGAWLYSQISTVSDRVSKSVRYCNFTVNGKSYQPSGGSKGDGSLSSRISQNPGQDWIVTALEQKAPVCICTEGKDGKAVIFQDPQAGLMKTQLLEVAGRTFSVTGNRLNVLPL